MRRRAVGIRGVEMVVLVLLAFFPARLPAQTVLQPTEIAANAMAATVQIVSLDEGERRLGTGTGFLISNDGLIVTNFHVIHRARSLRVELANGDEHAEVFFLAGDPTHDIAILKITAEGLTSLSLQSEVEPVVGQRIYTMGHPLGQTATFSDGLVSALRTVEDVSLIQITAPISSGSSGGPVMNEAGEVIGIVTMMLRGGQNLNFAVPTRYVGPLLARGDAPRPFAASVLPRVERRGIAALGRPPLPERRRPASSAPGAGLPEPTDTWEAQVLRQIVSLEAELVAEGVARRSHPVELGALRNGQSEEIAIELEGGAPYAMIAVCDADCLDIDLQLFAPDSTLLEEDRRVSDLPHVRFLPATSGSYRLRVIMAGCQAEPCRYGVASFILR
jgi:S1-C subfamily serine protease